jgi:hypothetical protein
MKVRPGSHHFYGILTALAEQAEFGGANAEQNRATFHSKRGVEKCKNESLETAIWKSRPLDSVA